MSRIIFPLDGMSLGQAEVFYETLKTKVAYFKAGLEMWTHVGPRIFAVIPEHRIMLDLKLHDIPSTLEKATQRACDHGVHLLTVHASAGVEAMKRCVLVTKGYDARVVAVTILTSRPYDEYRFRRYVENAYEAGVDHFVCSPKGREVKIVRSLQGKRKSTIITPGISLSGQKRDDQERVCTPKTAVENGSDYLVIGRPIREASEPEKVLDQINAEVEEALPE